MHAHAHTNRDVLLLFIVVSFHTISIRHGSDAMTTSGGGGGGGGGVVVRLLQPPADGRRRLLATR